MQVSVADDSPLGRYLADLDEESGPSIDSVAAQLGRACDSDASGSANTEAAPCSFPDKGDIPEHSDRGGLFLRLKRNAVLFAVLRLLDELEAEVPNLRDEVLEAAGLGEEPPRTTRWWLPQSAHALDAIPILTATSVLLVALGTATDAQLSMPWLRAWKLSLLLLLLLPLAAGLVELLHLGLLLRYSLVGRRLIKAFHLYRLENERLQREYQRSLDIVKRAELASRGYRLGRILPPVGRLEREDASCRLQCRRVRLKLRQINEQMERLSVVISERANVSTVQFRMHTVTGSNGSTNDAQPQECTPSLLITALQKRHQLGSLLVEQALRLILVEELACALRDRDFAVSTMLRQRMCCYSTLSQIVRTWTEDLARWNARVLRADLLTASTQEQLSEAAGDVPLRHGGKVPAEVEGVSRALEELQTTCETFKALIQVAQHDTLALRDRYELSDRLSPSTVLDAGEPGKVRAFDADRDLWSEQLDRSREQMRKLVQQLHDDWQRLDRMASIAYLKQSGTSTTSELSDPSRQDQEPNAVATGTRHGAAEDTEVAERECFLVFTGTSTGERDFNLQALLRQQQQDLARSAIAPVPSFVHELHDVLEKRQGLHQAQTVIKRIGLDPHEAGKAIAESLQKTPQSLNRAFPALPKEKDLQRLLQSRFASSAFDGDHLVEQHIDNHSDEDIDTDDGSHVGDVDEEK